MENLLGFGLADSIYADHVIVVTDNLVDFPCIPWQIQGNNVDCVVILDKIGEPEKIVSGTTQITKSPDRLHIAELTARFVNESGIMKNGFSYVIDVAVFARSLSARGTISTFNSNSRKVNWEFLSKSSMPLFNNKTETSLLTLRSS